MIESVESPQVEDLASIMASEEDRRRRLSKSRLGAIDGHRNRWYRGPDNTGPQQSIDEIQREEFEREQALNALSQVAEAKERERLEAERAIAAVAKFEQQQKSKDTGRRRNSGKRSAFNKKKKQTHGRSTRTKAMTNGCRNGAK